MKILFSTENSYAGGLDRVIIDLVDHWPEPSDELVLFCNRSHPGLDLIARSTERPVRIIAHDIPLLWQLKAWLDARPFPGGVNKALSVLARYPFFWTWRRAAKKLLKAEAPDRLLIINGGYPAGDSCRAMASVWPEVATNKPLCVFNFHNLAVAPRWWERWFETRIDQLVVRASKTFVAVSAACAASMANRPAIAASGKVGHILNGIRKPDDPAPQAARTLRADLGIAEGAPLCLMLGTYEPRKGHAFLLDAFSLVLKKQPTARLIICGHGYENDIRHVQALIADKGLGEAVRLENFREDVPVLIDAADVMLVSSQAFESFGLTIVEAMARATPVVATDIGGIPEVIGDNEGGYCLPADDIAGYAGRIISLLEDESLRHRIGAAGQARYRERFTAERMAADYARLVRQETG